MGQNKSIQKAYKRNLSIAIFREKNATNSTRENGTKSHYRNIA